MEVQKRYPQKHEIRIENKFQNGLLGEAKPSVSPYTCFQIDVFGMFRKSKKNGRPKGSKKDQRTTNHPDVGFLRSWCFVGGGVFSMFLVIGKSRPKIRNNQPGGPKKNIVMASFLCQFM